MTLTVFVDNEFDTNELLCVLLTKRDGSCSEYGVELKRFLTGFRVLNGFPVEEDSSAQSSKIANGAGHLAALFITHFTQNSPFPHYLIQPSIPDSHAEVIYTITAASNQPIRLKIDYLGEKNLFDGALDDFNPPSE